MANQKEKIYYQEAVPILVAVDCVILGFNLEELKLLLFKRRVEPFKGEWSVIGSFIDPQESVDATASRVLNAYTGLKEIFTEPLGCYGDVDRDPGARVISQSFFALIRLGEEEVTMVETHQARWFSIDDLPTLMLDHEQMVSDTLEKLRRKARYRPIGFELLPEKFTIPQLQKLYEAINQRAFDRRNFRKKILSMNVIEKLEEKDKSTSKKGAFLYRFNQESYAEMVEKGIDFVM